MSRRKAFDPISFVIGVGGIALLYHFSYEYTLFCSKIGAAFGNYMVNIIH